MATLLPSKHKPAWLGSQLARQMVQPPLVSAAQHSCAEAKMRMVTVRPLALNMLPLCVWLKLGCRSAASALATTCNQAGNSVQTCFGFWYTVVPCPLSDAGLAAPSEPTQMSVMPKQVATSIASLLPGLDSPSRTQIKFCPGLESECTAGRWHARPNHLKTRSDRSQKAALTAEPPSKTPITSKPVEAERLSSRDNKLLMLV